MPPHEEVATERRQASDEATDQPNAPRRLTLEHSDRLWDALDQDPAPTHPGTASWAAPVAHDPVAAPVARASSVRLGGSRRGIATALLAAGLLIVGGVAAVSAADPSAPPAPSASSEPSDPGSSGQPANPTTPNGVTGEHRGNCPADGSGGGSDNGSGGSGGSSTSPDASPDASGL